MNKTDVLVAGMWQKDRDDLKACKVALASTRKELLELKRLWDIEQSKLLNLRVELASTRAEIRVPG